MLNTIKSKSIKENNTQKINYNNNNKIFSSLNSNLCKNLSPFSCQNNKSVKNFQPNLMNTLYNNHYTINSNDKYDRKNFQKYIKKKGERILSDINNIHQIGNIKKDKHIIFPANLFKFH